MEYILYNFLYTIIYFFAWTLSLSDMAGFFPKGCYVADSCCCCCCCWWWWSVVVVMMVVKWWWW